MTPAINAWQMERQTVKARDSGVSGIVEGNIHELLEHRRRQQKERGLQDRIASGIGAFTGSMPFVYIHIAIFGSWIVINLGWTPIKPFDPSFVVLAMIASVEAIFVSTFVLITQNRMAALADDRADLDLTMSLLTEHEITRLLKMITAVARKMGVAESDESELAELTQDVNPEELLETLRRNKLR